MNRSSSQDIKKKKSIRLKIFGGTFLLLSFIIQNFTYDYWQSKSDEFEKAARDYDFLCHAGTSEEIAFYTSSFKDSTYQNAIKSHCINNSAKMYARALAQLIFVSELRDNDKMKYVNNLLFEAKKVNDFKTYQGFMAYSRQFDASYDYQGIKDKVLRIDRNKSISRWVFLLSYLFGSSILLIGIKYE